MKDDDLDNWFQVEIIDYEVVYACNICNEGFNNNNNVTEHKRNVHKEEIESMLTESSDGVPKKRNVKIVECKPAFASGSVRVIFKLLVANKLVSPSGLRPANL